MNTSENGGVEIIEVVGGATRSVELQIDPTFVAIQLTDIVPNPWMAYEIACKAIDLMIKRHTYEKVATDLGFIITDLKLLLEKERDRLARDIFHELVREKKVLFVLNIEFGYLLPDSIQVRNSRRLVRDNNDPIQRSLFEMVPEDELNEDEQNVAVHLDKQEQFILWWDRNYSRRGYYVQGWGKERIYPDFLVGKRNPKDSEDYDKILVIETKGRQLDNPDTTYKRSVFQLCNQLAKEWDDKLGRNDNNKRVEFYLMFHDEAQSQINKVLQEV